MFEDETANTPKAVLRPPTLPPLPHDPIAKNAMALGLVRADAEGTVTRTFAGKDGEGASKSEDDEDFDGLETLARRPESDMSEPETLARPISSHDRAVTDDETITRLGSSKADAENDAENDETLTTKRPPEPETIPRSDRVHVDAAPNPTLRRDTVPPPPLDVAQTNAPLRALVGPAPWSQAAVDPSPPPSPAIRTPFAMVTEPEDNLTRVAPVGAPVPAVGPHLQAPSNPIPYPQLPPPKLASVPIQRAVVFVSATLLVAAVVFFVLRPRSAQQAAATASEPLTPVAVEQLPAAAVTAPPVATVIAPAEPATAEPPATQPPAATAKAAPAPPPTTTSASHHSAPRKKHVHKHRVPTRREP